MIKLTAEQKRLEEQIIIDNYEFSSHTRSEKMEKHYQAVSEALKDMIKDNLEYLRYATAKHWFEMTPEEMQDTALHNALVNLVGREMKWSRGGAEKFAFEILQDVNAHPEAAKVAKILKLNLKSYEVE